MVKGGAPNELAEVSVVVYWDDADVAGEIFRTNFEDIGEGEPGIFGSGRG